MRGSWLVPKENISSTHKFPPFRIPPKMAIHSERVLVYDKSCNPVSVSNRVSYCKLNSGFFTTPKLVEKVHYVMSLLTPPIMWRLGETRSHFAKHLVPAER